MVNENIEYIINGEVLRAGKMTFEGNEYKIEVVGNDTELVAQLFDICPMRIGKYKIDPIKEKLKSEPIPSYEREKHRNIIAKLKSPSGDLIIDYLKKSKR
jgi:hypothetical protein